MRRAAHTESDPPQLGIFGDPGHANAHTAGSPTRCQAWHAVVQAIGSLATGAAAIATCAAPLRQSAAPPHAGSRWCARISSKAKWAPT